MVEKSSMYRLSYDVCSKALEVQRLEDAHVRFHTSIRLRVILNELSKSW